jgi:hypothetical protein
MITIIARTEIAAGLKRRFASNQTLSVFRDSDALPALEAIVARPPQTVAIDPLFAGTARGATLIARIRSEATLSTAELRLLVIDDQPNKLAQALERCDGTFEEALSAHSRPLDWCGTRRAPRFPIVADARAVINGQPSQIVNLSTSGVQVISPGRLRPAQGFRLTLHDQEQEVRLQAVVAWSTFQSSGQAPSYRAGAEFVDSNANLIEGFCARYGSAPDRTFVMPDGPPLSATVAGTSPGPPPAQPGTVDSGKAERGTRGRHAR